MFKIIAFFIITLFFRLYVMIGILLTRGKYLHDRIISLGGGFWPVKLV
jgi:Na+-transporting NADH:ubiquinone oxidoreductase subunit NqrA